MGVHKVSDDTRDTWDSGRRMKIAVHYGTM